MRSSFFSYARIGLLGCTAAVAWRSSAFANSVTVNDDYYGGTNYYNNNPDGTPPTGGVIGPAGITTSALVSLSNNTLTVTINSYFAGAPTNSSLANDVAERPMGRYF